MHANRFIYWRYARPTHLILQLMTLVSAQVFFLLPEIVVVWQVQAVCHVLVMCFSSRDVYLLAMNQLVWLRPEMKDD